MIASGSCDDQPGRRKASKYECESGILDKLQPRGVTLQSDDRAVVGEVHLTTIRYSTTLIFLWKKIMCALNLPANDMQDCKMAGKRLAQRLAANSRVVPTTGPPSRIKIQSFHVNLSCFNGQQPPVHGGRPSTPAGPRVACFTWGILDGGVFWGTKIR